MEDDVIPLNEIGKIEIVKVYNQSYINKQQKRIAELEKENAELKDKLKNLSKVAEVRLANWQKYEKENTELKKKIENLQKYLDTRNCYRECAETWEKLTKAKKIIGNLYAICKDNHYPNTSVLMEQAAQFLKERE